MVFSSLVFFIFLALVLAVYRSWQSWRARKIVLLIASYCFYAAWNPSFVILIWISTAVDWWAAKRMPTASSLRVQRLLLLTTLGTNLGLLGFFKYGDFLLANWDALMPLVGIDSTPLAGQYSIVLPVGISFYTFQTLSYSIDVYRGRLRPSNSPLDFALFVTFFPQLVSGPIVRASEFLPQLEEERVPTADHVGWGFVLLTVGLFNKMVLADYLLAPVADSVFADAAGAGFSEAWVGTLAFSGQLYFDFAGYSTCAIGVALVLGFALPDNFRHPYGSVGFIEFWRRWHITLSSWLRDYLYFSLGGNRAGAYRTYLNVMITMLLGGLWHGASWRFVLWGGLHGIYLVIERWFRARIGRPSGRDSGLAIIPGILLTQLLLCISWVFFRATDLSSAQLLLLSMFGGGPDTGGLLAQSRVVIVLILTFLMLLWHAYMRNRTLEGVWISLPNWLRIGVLCLLLASLILVPGDERAFLYFQF